MSNPDKPEVVGSYSLYPDPRGVRLVVELETAEGAYLGGERVELKRTANLVLIAYQLCERRAQVHGFDLVELRNAQGSDTMCEMNHPNRNWRKKLTVDLAAGEVRYEAGVIVEVRLEGVTAVGRIKSGAAMFSGKRQLEMVENACRVFARQALWRDINVRADTTPKS